MAFFGKLKEAWDCVYHILPRADCHLDWYHILDLIHANLNVTSCFGTYVPFYSSYFDPIQRYFFKSIRSFSSNSTPSLCKSAFCSS